MCQPVCLVSGRVRIIVRNVPLLLGALHLVSRVEGNQVHFDGVFQCLVNIGVIVDHRTGRHGFQRMQIKALNVLGLDSVQCIQTCDSRKEEKNMSRKL